MKNKFWQGWAGCGVLWGLDQLSYGHLGWGGALVVINGLTFGFRTVWAWGTE